MYLNLDLIYKVKDYFYKYNGILIGSPGATYCCISGLNITFYKKPLPKFRSSNQNIIQTKKYNTIPTKKYKVPRKIQKLNTKNK